MNGTRVYNAKQNKSVTERHIPYDFTSMWNPKKPKTNNINNNKKRSRLLNRENQLVVPRGEEAMGIGKTGEVD